MATSAHCQARVNILCLSGLLAQLGAEPRLHSFSLVPVQAEPAHISTEHGQNELVFTCKRVCNYAKQFQVACAYHRLYGQVANSLSKGQNKECIRISCSGCLLALEKPKLSMHITDKVISSLWVSLTVQQTTIFIGTFPAWPSDSEENNVKEAAFSQLSSLMKVTIMT